MRTTIDLPDTLYREAKARAALEGLSLKELLVHSIEAHLYGRSTETRPPAVSWKAEFDGISRELSLSARQRNSMSAVNQLSADRSRLDIWMADGERS